MIKIVREKILNYAGLEWVPIVLVGNKSDLHTTRQVPVEELVSLASQWRCCYIETSAKLNQSVAKVFELMISEIEKQNDAGNSQCVLL